MTPQLIDSDKAGSLLGISGRHFRRLFTETGYLRIWLFPTIKGERFRHLKVSRKDVLALQQWFKRSNAGRPKGESE